MSCQLNGQGLILKWGKKPERQRKEPQQLAWNRQTETDIAHAIGQLPSTSFRRHAAPPPHPGGVRGIRILLMMLIRL